MKFGKLEDISRVDFSLPPENGASAQLSGQSAREQFKAFVGCPRWSSPEWVGRLYPKGAPQGQYLYYYSRSFNGIELNSTHYRIPTRELVFKWRISTPSGFHFSPKIPQSISHYGKLSVGGNELTRFLEAIEGFEDRLGCSFVQLHPSFGPDWFNNLVLFLQAWPQEFPLAIEFRHPDWFDHHRLTPRLEVLLRKHQVTALVTDVAGRRDVLHQSLTTDTLMLRLVGNSLHPTDYQRADDWLDRIEHWVDHGLKTLYLFPHEPGDGQAADFGEYIIRQLNERFNLKLPIPQLPQVPGSQLGLF